MPRLLWAGKTLTVFLLLLALSSRPLSAGSFEFDQPTFNPAAFDPTPQFTPLKIYSSQQPRLHLSVVQSWARGERAAVFLLLVRHAETRWTRLRGSFAFTLDGT